MKILLLPALCFAPCSLIFAQLGPLTAPFHQHDIRTALIERLLPKQDPIFWIISSNGDGSECYSVFLTSTNDRYELNISSMGSGVKSITWPFGITHDWIAKHDVSRYATGFPSDLATRLKSLMKDATRYSLDIGFHENRVVEYLYCSLPFYATGGDSLGLQREMSKLVILLKSMCVDGNSNTLGEFIAQLEIVEGSMTRLKKGLRIFFDEHSDRRLRHDPATGLRLQ